MAEITEARLVGDWRRIVGDHVVSYENGGELDDVGVTGTVTLTPNFGKGPQGVLADDASLYTAHEIKCRVIWGRLHDNDLNNPWQDLIVAVDGKPIVWTAAFSLTYKWRSDVQAQKINLPQVTFDVSAVLAGEISLTSLIPSAQIPSNYQQYLVSAQASAQVASDAKTVAELSAVAADQAKADATLAKTAAETAKTAAETAATLATTEADRAVGLATAQDQAVADTVTAGGPTTTALNATYGTKAEVAEKVDKTVADTSYVPAELAVTFIHHGSNGSTPRGDAPGRRIWVGTVMPTAFQEGVDLFMRPATGGGGDLPAPTLLEDLPATGLQSVWDADTIGLASGSTVNTWPDLVGTVHLTGTSGPTVNTVAGRTFVSTDGTASYIQAAAGLVVGQPLTIAVVGRYVAPAPNALMLVGSEGGGLSLGVTDTGAVYSFGGAAAIPGPSADDQWHVFLVTHNSPTSELRIDSTIAASGDFGTRGLPGGIRFGAGGPNNRTALEIASCAVWNRALTTAERADLSTKLMARYAIGG